MEKLFLLLPEVEKLGIEKYKMQQRATETDLMNKSGHVKHVNIRSTEEGNTADVTNRSDMFPSCLNSILSFSCTGNIYITVVDGNTFLFIYILGGNRLRLDGAGLHRRHFSHFV